MDKQPNNYNTKELSEMIKKNQGLVMFIAKKYLGKGLDLEDLLQEGYIGLLTAAKSYNKKKSKFSTYAYLMIRSAIIKAIKDTGSLIRIPAYCNTLQQPNWSNIDNTKQYTTIDDDIVCNNILDDICKILDNDKTDIFIYLSYYMSNKSLRDIASELGISHQSVSEKLSLLHTLVTNKLNTD